MARSKKISLQFSVNWLLAIGVIAIGLIVSYIYEPTWHDTLVFVAAVAAGAGTLMAAFSALDAASDQVLQQRQAVALNFLLQWLDPQLFHAKKNGREILKFFRQHQRVEEQKAHLENDATLLANFFDVLNFFEALSIAIREGLAEEPIVRQAFQSLVLEYWHVAGEFMKARRAERQNVRLFEGLEWLFTRWT